MKKRNFNPVLHVVLLLAVSLSFAGCSGTLEQREQIVRIAPVSDEYKLNKRLEGRTYVLLAQTDRGKELHRAEVSDSLAKTLKQGYQKDYETSMASFTFSILGYDNKQEKEIIPNKRLEVLSFSDFANKLNEKGLCQQHADMREFYRKTGMFRKSDLELLAKEIGADYIIMPCLIEIDRWSKGRLSVAGVKFLNTQVVNGILAMEIWDTRTGHKVFSATSDVTLANERIKEAPIAMEEAFNSAWLGIMKELPGYPALAEEQNPGQENDPAAESETSYVKEQQSSEYETKRPSKS